MTIALHILQIHVGCTCIALIVLSHCIAFGICKKGFGYTANQRSASVCSFCMMMYLHLGPVIRCCHAVNHDPGTNVLLPRGFICPK